MDKRQVWQAVLGELELQVTRPNFDTWLRDTWLVGEEDGVCTVAVGKPMALEWVESRFGTLVKKTLRSILGRPVEVRFVPGTSRVDPSPPMDLPLARVAAPTPTERPRPASEGSPLNPRYTFSTFVVGNSNRLAHAACQAVAERPASAYNPLFIYGGVGLGKTHLLHAIGNECLRRGLRVVYVSSETFTNELIEAIREHRTDDFRRKYRSVSVLLIDDIQFIASKERTQEEFFHTFNSVHEANGQIVLSSDRPPKAIPTLEDRLRSRFEWGLIADIQPPDLETRIAILRSKTASHGAEVPDDVIDFIAQRIQSNIRELEGALTRVLAYATMNRQPLSVAVASAALQDVLLADVKRHISPDAVLQAVSRHFGVALEDLKGKQRDKRVVVPRQIAMYLLREDAGLSLVDIGGLLGGRDHSTVLHGCEKIATELESSGEVRGAVRAVRELYRGEES